MMMFNAGPGGPYMGRGDMADMMAMDGGMGDKDGRRGDKDHRGMPPGGSGAYLRPSHYQVRSPRPPPRPTRVALLLLATFLCLPHTP